MKPVIIVMARIGSSRLPGKVLLPLGGAPILAHLLTRLRSVNSADAVVVATSDMARDEQIVEVCQRLGVPVFRGSEIDTMDRFYRTAEAFNADIAVRVTADCPLIDPATVDLVIHTIENTGADYVSTDIVPMYPNGMGCDGFSRSALRRLYEVSRNVDPDESWMLTRDDSLGLVRTQVPAAALGNLSDYRVTVDTPEDYALVSKIFSVLPDIVNYTLDDIICVLRQHPEWRDINAAVKQKTGPHRQLA